MIEYIQKHCIGIIISIIALAVLVIVIILNTSDSEVSGLKKQISDLEKKDSQHMKVIDSSKVVILKQADSLRIAKRTIFLKHEETLKAHANTQRIIKSHESITFKPLTDLQRDSTLAKLYVTFRPIR